MLKINDDDLMQKIWQLQIKKTASGVLERYVGGTYGVINNDNDFMKFAVDIHIAERHQITCKIGKQQMLKRIRELVENKKLMWLYHELTFSIADKHKVVSLFNDARKAWLDLGVPTGSENSRCLSIKIDDFDSKLAQVQRLLLDKYLVSRG
ncbi:MULTISPECIES: hypothetical protein [Shewanella]|uniref:hypothetical protein n=1 Tax=Shewanella TaxID=22 RepID=UPI00216865BA|nr:MULTISPECIES: hypothetical protein [Shewanella]MCS6114478.1 hypothetical protein [Shewanella baltica]MCU8034386.1 hypothetical protein [Shewanella sp. SM71]MCU8096093.1 hypothetical protein [Shewanella sp. SM102]UVW65384.1 hypothetical protein HHE93_18150 [Shewanella baltica]